MAETIPEMDESLSKRVLIGCVGNNDPTSERGEGPLATAARALQPDRVDLIYSPLTKNLYEATYRHLWMELGIEERHPWFLPLENPTRYDEFIDPLVDRLLEIQASLPDPDPEFHIVASAAPQLRTVLLLATVSRVITARLWHVDEPSLNEGERDPQLDPELSAAKKHDRAKHRLSEVTLHRFEGAALRFFRDIRLHLTVERVSQSMEHIHAEIVPHRWLDRDPAAGPIRLLYELAKARIGKAYDVSLSGGWVQGSRLAALGDKPSARTQAIQSLNEEAAALDVTDPPTPLIEVRGSHRQRQYRVALEPHEIFIEHV